MLECKARGNDIRGKNGLDSEKPDVKYSSISDAIWSLRITCNGCIKSIIFTKFPLQSYELWELRFKARSHFLGELMRTR